MPTPVTPHSSGTFLVSDFGAHGDGRQDDTVAVQAAIDAAQAWGGGRVLVPRGRFRCGTLSVKSGVTLEITAEGTLLAAEDMAAFPPLDYIAAEDSGHHQRARHHFIVVRDAQRVTLCGSGTIDGSGQAFAIPAADPAGWWKAKDPRPDAMLAVARSRDVTIRDLTLTNPPNWHCDLYGSDRVLVHGVRIVSDHRGPNNDGIDISGSHDVVISDSIIDTGDDGIVINTRGRSVERVTVSNCVIRSDCAALKIGWEYTRHDIRGIAFANCALSGCNRALAAYSCNGAVIEDIAVSNLTIDTNAEVMFARPIHLDLRRGRDTSVFGAIRNVVVSNLVARTQGRLLLTSEDGGCIEDLTLRDIHLAYPYLEDPEPSAEANTSSQFSNRNRAARRARAAVVAENIRGLCVENLRTTWPSAPAPAAWRIAAKRENGGTRIFRPEYDAAPPPFHALWGRNLHGTWSAPLATASAAGVPALDVVGGALRVRE